MSVTIQPRTAEKRIPSLDGLRAVAIGLVILCHLGANLRTHNGFILPYTQQAIYVFGLLGVTVFFVISGYLITTLLLRESEGSGTISLPRFYFRRTFRLLPAYYALIAFVAAGYFLGAVKTEGWQDIVLHALTYTTNYNHTSFWYLGHSWTLSVEEQFYLLWPMALLLLGKRRGLMSIALLLLICPVMRTYYASLPAQASQWNLQYRFEAVADSLACGCLLAGVRPWLKTKAVYDRMLKGWLILIAILWILLCCMFSSFSAFDPINYSITIAAITICLDWALTFPDTLVGRILNSRPFITTGILSYSIYLWQQPFFNPYTHSPISRFPANVILVVAAAIGSYYCVERPGLNFRDKIYHKLFGKR